MCSHGLQPQQASSPGFVAAGAQPDSVACRFDRSLALAVITALLLLWVFSLGQASQTLALVGSPLAASLRLGGPQGRCHRRAQRQPPSASSGAGDQWHDPDRASLSSLFRVVRHHACCSPGAPAPFVLASAGRQHYLQEAARSVCLKQRWLVRRRCSTRQARLWPFAGCSDPSIPGVVSHQRLSHAPGPTPL